MIAELLAGEGLDVALVTPAAHVSQWTTNTLEVSRIRKRVIRAGVDVRTNTAVTAVTAGRRAHRVRVHRRRKRLGR